MRYDAATAAAFYDDYGEREWTRFEDYLRRFVCEGDRVLDVGPGRFTLELVALVALGARVVAADLSQFPDDAFDATLSTPGGVAALVEAYGAGTVREVTATGVLRPEPGALDVGHHILAVLEVA